MSKPNPKPKSVQLNLCLSYTAYDIIMKKSEEANVPPSVFADRLIRENAVTYAELVQGVMKYDWDIKKFNW